MRMDKKTEVQEIKSERALHRKKKMAVFMLVFSFYLGLTVVDSACSEMTRHPGALTLQSKRIDADHLFLSFLGKEAMVDTRSILNEFSRVKEDTKGALSCLVQQALDRKDVDDFPERRDAEYPLPSKIL